MKLSVPYKGASPLLISQTYHEGHPALDMVSNDAVGAKHGWGVPLCAPERIEVVRITGDTYTPESNRNLERGYGIYLHGLETGFTHLFWHTVPVFPVRVGDIVERGQIVAFMGNAGLVYVGGTYVPIDERNTDASPGTHLHWELFDQTYRLGGEKPFLNPLGYIDWSLQPTYGTAGLLAAISTVVGKTLKLIKK